MEHYKNLSLIDLSEEIDGILITEVWAWIVRFTGLYKVSTFGRVKSFAYGKQRILRQARDKKGYCRVCLTSNYVKETVKVHREVGIAFLPNPTNLPEINHIAENGSANKTDNRVVKLEWNTGSDNMKHAYEKGGLKPKGHYVGKLAGEHPHARKIICVNDGVVYETIREAAKFYNILESGIGRVCKGENKQTKGYVFKYV